jgi:hypothetical protein
LLEAFSREAVDLADLERGIPFPGYLYQVRSQDTQARMAGDALYNAAKQAGLPEDVATRLYNSPQARAAYLDLVFCAPWNDKLGGTYKAGGGDHKGPHSRTIRFVRAYPDNRERISTGNPPLRNVELGAPGQGGKARALDPVFATHLPYLWLPPLNEEALAQGAVTTQGLRWDDDGSVLYPPPEVDALGWASVEDLTGQAWGCAPGGQASAV